MYSTTAAQLHEISDEELELVLADLDLSGHFPEPEDDDCFETEEEYQRAMAELELRQLVEVRGSGVISNEPTPAARALEPSAEKIMLDGKSSLAELDAALEQIVGLNELSEIRALSDTPDLPKTPVNTSPNGWSDGFRAVGRIGGNLSPALRAFIAANAHTPKAVAPRITHTPSHTLKTTPPTPIPASVAQHHRQHAPQIAAELAQKRAAYLAKHGAAPVLTGPWKSLSEAQKHVAAGIAAEHLGGQNVTIQFGDVQHQTLIGHKDALGYVRRRVQTIFAKHGLSGVPVQIMLGISGTGRIHLHGNILPGAHPLPLIKSALFDVAGKTTGMKARLVTARDVFYGPGTIGYAGKTWDRTDHREEGERLAEAFPGQPTTYMNDEMRRVARALYEAGRPAIRPRKKRKTVTVETVHPDTLPAPANQAALRLSR